MAGVTIRSNWAANLLVTYITEEVKVLEPNLQFARLGVKKDLPKGYNTIDFPQTNAFATTDVGTITEGTNPTAVTWGATSYQATATQYGLVVQVSDLLVRNSAVEVITSATEAVKTAVARKIDVAIQAVVNANTNGVVYAGGKASRAALAAGDLVDHILMGRAKKLLRARHNDPYEGGYFTCVLHTDQEHDLMYNTSTGSWTDVGRYTNVDDLRKGEAGTFRGIRYLASSNVQSYASTTTVYPATLLAANPFGWGFYQQPTPEIVMGADSNNPLGLFSSIGVKTTLGITKFEDASGAYRVARIESAVSA